tara:strand:+ start:209 stop:409 length:201 start_codon:yes stop_codon:yes gene_type:complete
MKKLLLSFYALTLILSVVSCKENTTETTVESEEAYEVPAEVIETPVVEEVDTTVIDSTAVDANAVQ